MQPRVAILLAAFNGKQWLKEQIDSILSQEEVAVSLYINVDQSSDGTEDFVDQLSKQDPRIHKLPHGNYYGGAAPNFYHLIKTIDYSQFDFVALSDQDDIWLHKKLFTAITNLNKFNSDAYSSNVTAFWPDNKKMLINKAQEQVQWDFLFESAGPGCTYVLTRDFAIDLQKFIRANWDNVSSISLHDWLIYAYARANGYKWFIDSYSSLLYRQHTMNQVGANIGLIAFLARTEKVLNGWALSQSLLIANVIGLSSNPFVLSWSICDRLSYLSLSGHFWQCRRKIKDKILFLLACLSLSIIPPPKLTNKKSNSVFG